MELVFLLQSKPRNVLSSRFERSKYREQRLFGLFLEGFILQCGGLFSLALFQEHLPKKEDGVLQSFGQRRGKVHPMLPCCQLKAGRKKRFNSSDWRSDS